MDDIVKICEQLKLIEKIDRKNEIEAIINSYKLMISNKEIKSNIPKQFTSNHNFLYGKNLKENNV